MLMLRLKSKQISELFQKRGFKGPTGVIGCADSDVINAQYLVTKTIFVLT